MHHHIEVIFSTQQHVHDVQCLGMASASSVTFHAWAWPRRPIIEGGSTTDPGTVEGEEEEGGWAEEEAGWGKERGEWTFLANQKH